MKWPTQGGPGAIVFACEWNISHFDFTAEENNCRNKDNFVSGRKTLLLESAEVRGKESSRKTQP
jgi:hypothetical protein